MRGTVSLEVQAAQRACADLRSLEDFFLDPTPENLQGLATQAVSLPQDPFLLGLESLRACARKTAQEAALFKAETGLFLPIARLLRESGERLARCAAASRRERALGLEQAALARKGFGRVEALCRQGEKTLLESERVVHRLKNREVFRRLSELAAYGTRAAESLAQRMAGER
jgi:hypothetical protein